MLAEMGDKTQLLAFTLASRYRAPWIVISGIFFATLMNHTLAANFGGWVSSHLPPLALKLGLAACFIGFALWTLKPDVLEEEKMKRKLESGGRWKAFFTTIASFFMVEMGDKTQLATVALGAKYHDAIPLVTMGTTAGMLVSDGLAVFLGQKLAHRLPMNWIRRATAILFLILGILTLGTISGVMSFPH